MGIYILFFEKVDQTIKCLESFQLARVPTYILNNASSKKSREKLDYYCSKHTNITIFDSPRNLGPAVGRNYLIDNTKEEWLLFVDNDVYTKTKDWLPRIKKHIAEHPEVEVFIPRLFIAHENHYARYKKMKIEEKKVSLNVNIENNITNNFPAGASFVNRKLFKRLGCYDDKLFGFEEYELAIRGLLVNEPIRTMIVDNIAFVHEHTYAKTEEDAKAALTRYDYETNKSSYDRIREKHGLSLQTSWESWNKEQAELTLKHPVFLKDVVWKRWMPKLIQRGVRKIRRKLKS